MRHFAENAGYTWLCGPMANQLTTCHSCSHMFDDKLHGSQSQNAGEGKNSVQISTRQHGQTTILAVSGDIDSANSLEVRQSVLHEIQENHTSRLLVNLGQVRYLDSSGVASLVEGLKASRHLGSRLILFGLNPSLREVFELSRLIKVFEVYDNEEQALAA